MLSKIREELWGYMVEKSMSKAGGWGDMSNVALSSLQRGCVLLRHTRVTKVHK
jgi:hypothetical protein